MKSAKLRQEVSVEDTFRRGADWTPFLEPDDALSCILLDKRQEPPMCEYVEQQHRMCIA